MKLFSIARWEYLQRIKSKWFLISTLLLPVLIIGISVLPVLLFQGGTQIKTFAMIDQSGWVGDELRAEFSGSYQTDEGRPVYEWIPLSRQNVENVRVTADSLLSQGVADGYVIIPEDVLRSHQIQYYAESVANIIDQERLKKELDTILDRRILIQHGLAPDLVSSISEDVHLEAFEVRKGETRESDITAFLGPMFYVILLFFSIFITSQILMRSVLEERQTRVIELLVSSSTPKELMAGKILGIGAMGMTQVVLYMIAAQVASSHFGTAIITLDQLAIFVLYFIPGYLLYAAFYAAVGSLFTSEQEAQQAISFMTFIVIIPLVLIQFVMQSPNAPVFRALSFFPPLTPFFMMIRMDLVSIPLWEYVGTIAVLVLFAVLVVLAAGKIFNTTILMYGKRPTLPEIIRWLRA